MGKKRAAITPNVTERELGKLSKKELGKSIGGNPDEWDYVNIKVLIDTYEHAYPRRLAKMKHDYDIEASLTLRTKDFGEISKDSGMRVAFWLPEDLENVISAAYPSLWTNPKHLAWFVNHFPIFKMADKH